MQEQRQMRGLEPDYIFRGVYVGTELYMWLEELRQQEQKRIANEFEQARKRDQQMQQFKNRKSQQKIEKEQKEKELFEIQMDRWANFNTSAYIDHPATIEMVQKFSAPIEPFVYRNLPVPRALPNEYRNPVPILDDDDNDDS